MITGVNFSCFFLCCLALVITSSPLINAQTDVPSQIFTSTSSSWINSPGHFNSGQSFNAILERVTRSMIKFGCGFYCRLKNGDHACLFAIWMAPSFRSDKSQLVWSATHDKPFKSNSTLRIDRGDLILSEADGSPVWSTNTGKVFDASGLNLTDAGCLVLFDHNGDIFWQSFEQPTDTLVPGQVLAPGQRLTASTSYSNWRQGLFVLSVNGGSLVASIKLNSSALQIYYKSITVTRNDTERFYTFKNGSFGSLHLPSSVSTQVPFVSIQFLKFGSDGHLRLLGWNGQSWKEVYDVLTSQIGECGYPLVCGEYGICSKGPLCNCPDSTVGQASHFNYVDVQQRNLGCIAQSSISCASSQDHDFLMVENLYYFGFSVDIADTEQTNCKQACLRDCSCKASIFQHRSNASKGDCSLLSEVLSFSCITDSVYNYTTSAFIKVQSSPKKNRKQVGVILGSIVGAIFCLSLVICCFFFLGIMKCSEKEVDYPDLTGSMLTRFSYEDLKAMTRNFSVKLGEGGFGSVFEGTLPDGNKIAVKQLIGVGQVSKSFLAEVETIGSIHHFNLVKLIGLCAGRSHRLLVYEYMCNGSLDKWIFQRNQELALGWQPRKKIILDIAKGLAYLHEECRQKIIHLDIKPQNILLDENLNAKVSDFGLSKLIDRNQSQVVTTVRGTPGYLAPEWLNSYITEKVDVYSYGVVVMETLCGRTNFDRSEPEEDMHLLSMFKRKAQAGQLLDMVDKNSADMQANGAEVVQMMKVAAWCLQNDFSRRPSMSMVVKVLEGSANVEDDLEYDVAYPRESRAQPERIEIDDPTRISASVLSGPR